MGMVPGGSIRVHEHRREQHGVHTYDHDKHCWREEGPDTGEGHVVVGADHILLRSLVRPGTPFGGPRTTPPVTGAPEISIPTTVRFHFPTALPGDARPCTPTAPRRAGPSSATTPRHAGPSSATTVCLRHTRPSTATTPRHAGPSTATTAAKRGHTRPSTATTPRHAGPSTASSPGPSGPSIATARPGSPRILPWLGFRLVMAVGVFGQIVAVGVFGQIVAVGVFGQIVAVGVFGQIVAVGVFGQIVAVGVFGQIVAVGVFGQIVAVGVFGQIVAVGVFGLGGFIVVMAVAFCTDFVEFVALRVPPPIRSCATPCTLPSILSPSSALPWP